MSDDVMEPPECASRMGCVENRPHHHVTVRGDVLTHFGPADRCESVNCEARRAYEDITTGKQDDLRQQLNGITDWWIKTAMADAEKTLPKAIEYGSADFDLMGQFMVALVKDKLEGATDDEKLRVGREMAVTFYLIGKLGRMVGAYATGVLPSDDTLFDTNIYSMMLRRIRETGHWVE